MANRHMKRCSILGKCKSKLQWGIISHQSEWPSSKSLQTVNARQGVEKREPSCTVGGNANWYSHYREQHGESLKKLGEKKKPTIWPSNHTTGYIPSGNHKWKDTCTPMFTEALFTIARTQKQPRCPLADEWIKKLWYIYKGLLVSYKKGCIWVSFNKVDECRAYYTEWVSQKERSIIYQHIYMESKKVELMIRFAGQLPRWCCW